MTTYSTIDEAIIAGFKLHAFRSGGGLRVISLKKGESEKFYGESFDLENALRVLTNDILAGGRTYKETYMLENSPEPHYLTGAYPTDEDYADRYVCASYDLDAELVGDKIQVTVETSLHTQHRQQHAFYHGLEQGADIYYSIEGYKSLFKTSRVQGGWTTKTAPYNKMIDFDKIKIIGTGNTFLYALMNAMCQHAEYRLKFTVVSREEFEKLEGIEQAVEDLHNL